jgi:hypothetical protein
MDNSRKEFERLRNVIKEFLPDKCANCGAGGDLHIHHIVPLINGGTNRITNLVNLCETCHGLVHGLKMTHHRKATKAGLEKARARGRSGGRPKKDVNSVEEALEMYDSGKYTVPEITEATGVGKTTIYKALKERSQG